MISRNKNKTIDIGNKTQIVKDFPSKRALGIYQMYISGKTRVLLSTEPNSSPIMEIAIRLQRRSLIMIIS